MLLVLLCKKCKANIPETLGRWFLLSFPLVFSLFQCSSAAILGPLLWLTAFTLSVYLRREAAGALQRNDELLTSIVVNVRDWSSPPVRVRSINKGQSRHLRSLAERKTLTTP